LNLLTIETSTLRTWAALEEVVYDGWVLRFANGYTGRSNSVIALYGSSLDIQTKIDYCEAQYRQRGLVPRFRVIPDSYPADLDIILEQRGYRYENESRVMTLDLSRITPFEPQTRVEIRLESEFHHEWARAFCEFNTAQSVHFQTLCQLLPTIKLPTCYASVVNEGEVVAVALLVRDGDYAGLYDVATRQTMRGRGIGKILIGSLLTHALRDEVKTVYLQMLATNAPAYRLYSGFGFREVYRYWYRVLNG
jgi:N-acetylglutamate synthase